MPLSVIDGAALRRVVVRFLGALNLKRALNFVKHNSGLQNMKPNTFD